MPLPDFTPDGYLPHGIYAASLAEVVKRFGTASPARNRQAELLRQIVEAAKNYPTIKRVLLWGSFITTKLEPADLDYSIIVSIDHGQTILHSDHRRFFRPLEARVYYGVDRGTLVLPDYPLELYIERVHFFCHTRERSECGIVEINIHGEIVSGR